MRVVSVPGRLVRHPVTRRVIDEAGVLIDPNDLSWVNLIADGDVELTDDLPDDDDQEEPDEPALPAAKQEKAA